MAALNELQAILGLMQQGFTPEQARAQVDEAKAMEFAKLRPEQMLGFNLAKSGQQLGRGLSSLFGVAQEDPTVKMATQMRQLQQEYDTSTAAGMLAYSQALRAVNPALAQQAALEARKMEKQEAEVSEVRSRQRRTEAQAKREESTAQREEQLQNALSQLPENASESDLLKVLRKYGTPDKVEASITRSQNLRAQIEARAAEATARAQANLEAQLQRAKDQKERDEAQRAHQMELERIRQEGRREQAAFVAALKTTATQDKPMDDKAANQVLAITSSQPIIADGDALISKIKPAEGPAKEAFTLTSRATARAASLAGRRTEASGLISDVDSYLNRARNAYLLAAKGTQTEGDAQRAWEQFSTSLDFTTADGVITSIRRVQEELRRQQQGAASYLTARGFKPPEIKEAPKDKFVVGQIYKDAKGNRAEYLGDGKWKEIK